MNRTIISDALITKIAGLLGDNSNRNIAELIGVSLTTVKRIIRENGLIRSKEQQIAIRSKSRKNLIRAERRRAIFGLDQKTGIKVFKNRERNQLKYCLKRRHYRFLRRGDNTAYFDENTNRYPLYEERGSKLGLKFKPIEQYQ